MDIEDSSMFKNFPSNEIDFFAEYLDDDIDDSKQLLFSCPSESTKSVTTLSIVEDGNAIYQRSVSSISPAGDCSSLIAQQRSAANDGASNFSKNQYSILNSFPGLAIFLHQILGKSALQESGIKSIRPKNDRIL